MTEPDSELALGILDPRLESGEERRLSELLRSAYTPTEIDPARHERLLASALEDPFAPPSAEEVIESERLRQALDGQGEHEDAVLARAVAAAFAPNQHPPRPLPGSVTSRQSIASQPAAPGRRSKLILLRFAGGGAALAAAAVVLLSILPSPRRDPAPDLRVFALAQSRSTASLFRAGSGEAASSRIDRIASARGRDLRDNRYATWGVR